MYKIGVYKFGSSEMIEKYAPCLDISITSSIFLKKIQDIDDGFENNNYIFLGYHFIFFAMFLY